MKRIYWFKILAMILCGYFTLPIQGWVLFIGLGHVLDVIYPQIKNINAKKLEYQKITEDLLYLLAYNCFRLGLDKKLSFAYINLNNNVYDYYACRDLFFHYCDVLDKTGKYDATKVENTLNSFTRSNDSVHVFKIIEGMVDYEFEDAPSPIVNKLKEIASEFNISYSRQENYTYTENKTSKQSYSYNSKSESDNSSSYQKSNTANNNQNNSQQKEYSGFQYEEKLKEEPKPAISKQVKDAFAVFGFKPEDEVSLIELKRIYRKKAMKLHPDILKGQNVSDEKLKKAESELAEVNIAMDIVKKFLANN